MHLIFEWIRQAADFRALEPQWRDLYARAEVTSLFQSFSWQWRAWEHVAAPLGHQLRILVGRVDDRAVLIWPLVLVAGTLRFLSSEQTEYRDVLVESGPDSDRWLNAGLNEVFALKGGQRILLFDVRADSRLAGLLARRAPRGLRVDRNTWLIRLDRWSGWDHYATHLTQRLRADQRRQWRRIAALPGEIQFRIVTDLPEILRDVDWFFEQKTHWLKARGVSAPSFSSAPYRAFVGATVAETHRSGQLVFGKLASTEETLSVGFGYAVDGVFLFQAYAYIPEFGSLSPSRLLLEQLIRWCFLHGIREFDFLPWDIAYKARWSDETFPVHDYVLPVTLAERIRCEVQRLRIGRHAKDGWLLRQYHRLPASVRSRIRGTALPDWDFGAPVQRMRRRSLDEAQRNPGHVSGSPT